MTVLRSATPILVLAWTLSTGAAAADGGGAVETSPSREQAAPVLGVFPAAAARHSAVAEEIRRGAEIASANRGIGAGPGSGGGVRLVTARALDPWRAGAAELVRLAYELGAAAVLGPVDGQASHVAAQVAARARGDFVLLTPWASDPRLTRAGVPWFLRLVHDDRLQAEALLGEIVLARGLRRVLLLVDPGDSDFVRAASELDRAATQLGAIVRRVGRSADGTSARAAVLAEARIFGAQAVGLLVSPEEAARVARELRGAGLKAALFGPLRLASESFVVAAGEAAEGTVIAAPAPPGGTRAEIFRARYRRLHGREASTASLYGHDGADILGRALAEVRQRGEEGAPGEALRAVLTGRAWDGLTGRIELDRSGNRVGPAPLSRVERGALKRLELRQHSQTQDSGGSPQETRKGDSNNP